VPGPGGQNPQKGGKKKKKMTRPTRYAIPLNTLTATPTDAEAKFTFGSLESVAELLIQALFQFLIGRLDTCAGRVLGVSPGKGFNSS